MRAVLIPLPLHLPYAIDNVPPYLSLTGLGALGAGLQAAASSPTAALSSSRICSRSLLFISVSSAWVLR